MTKEEYAEKIKSVYGSVEKGKHDKADLDACKKAQRLVKQIDNYLGDAYGVDDSTLKAFVAFDDALRANIKSLERRVR